MCKTQTVKFLTKCFNFACLFWHVDAFQTTRSRYVAVMFSSNHILTDLRVHIHNTAQKTDYKTVLFKLVIHFN